MNTKIGQILVAVFIMTLLSCKKDVEITLPFEEEKVVSLLGDMHFAKSASMIHKIEYRDSMQAIYEAQVLTINNVSREEYNGLLELLESDLKLYYDIEKKVHTHLKSVQNKKD